MYKLPKSSNQSSSKLRCSSSSSSLEETARSSDTSSDNDNDIIGNSSDSDGFEGVDGIVNEDDNDNPTHKEEQQLPKLSRTKPIVRKITMQAISSSSRSTDAVPNEASCSLDDHADVSKKKYKTVIGIILLVPILGSLLIFYQGVSLLLEYRIFFGEHAPIPFLPSHGVVAAHHPASQLPLPPLSSKPSIPHYKSIISSPRQHLYAGEESEHFHFKKYNATHIMTRKSLHLKPIRLLVIGDSVACGVGQVNSCYPLLPEAIGSVLSKEYGGRPVFWSVFGQPGATIKWVANKVNQQVRVGGTRGKEHHVSMQNFYSMSLEPTGKNDVDNNANDDIDREQAHWVRKLKYHQELYDANPFAGYDYIIAISGVNDIKRILVPFLVPYDDDDNNDDARDTVATATKKVKEWGFGGDLKRLVRDLHKIAHDHDQPTDSCFEIQGQTCPSIIMDEDRKLPYIVFPQFPIRQVPAKTGAILRWMAITFTGILDSIKTRVADENPDYFFAAPTPGLPANGLSYSISEPWVPGVLREEEVFLRLSNFNREECVQLTGEMQAFYSGRKAKQEKNMMASEMFSNDAMHPNDWGYNYFGTFLGQKIVQRWNAGSRLDVNKVGE